MIIQCANILLKHHYLKQRGFTLLEVMISLFIFSIVLTGMSRAFIQNIRANTSTQIRTEAIGAAQQVLDNVRLQDISALPTSGSSAPQSVVVGNHTYTVVIKYCLDVTMCALTSTRHLTVDVDYNSERVFETETVFTQLR